MLLERLEPLLSNGEKNLKVLVIPMTRYLEDCCTIHARDEAAKLLDGNRQLKELWKLRKGVKSFLIVHGIKKSCFLIPWKP
jgi:hypothetical protein